jgi:glyoxylase-like metal-dependent hydrolase (beta-lactamase superfamily II)
MLRRITHGPVTQFEWSWWRSRQLGYAVNSYLLRGELIDTGFPAARPEFSQLLEEVRPERVTLTHHHEDHAGNLDRVIARGIPIRAAPATATLLPIRVRLPLYRWWTWGPHRPAAGAMLEMSDRGTTLIPTPGHSDDHHVVWDAEEGILFSGDLFLAVKTRLINAWEDPRRSVHS